MEWAVWTASSDSEDAMTQEINEEERAPSNRDQQDSIYGAGEQSSTKEAHGSLELAFIKKAASTRNGWDSRDTVKAEAGQKLADNGGQHLTHFGEKQGIKLSAPYSMGSTCTVNSSDGAGILDCEPENITMQMMREDEDEDEEQVLVTQEDLGESTEELEFDSSTSINGFSQKLNPGRCDVQRKKRNLTKDGLGQVSKLVKRSEHPQENQLSCASRECGESTLDPSCSQWNKSFQSQHLAGNGAADEPMRGERNVWVIGHSIVARAASRYHGGDGPKQASAKGLRIHWIGKEGLTLDDTWALISDTWQDRILPAPDVMVVHVGGNDMKLGRMQVKEEILSLFSWIHSLFPEVVILWSAMFSRKYWGLGPSERAINISARRLNTDLRKVLTGKKLGMITYNLVKGPSMYASDGVHLSDLGTDTFILTIVNDPQLMGEEEIAESQSPLMA